MDSAAAMFDRIDALRLTRLVNGLQQTLDWRARTPIADTLAGLTRNLFPPPAPLPPDLAERAGTLRRDGVLRLGRLLAAEQVAAIHEHLRDKPCFTGHVPAQGDGVPRTLDDCAPRSNCASYRLADVLAAPHLLELANRDDILALAEAHLGCVPTIYSMNMFWSFPEKSEKVPSLQCFHRDFDDFRFCTLFVFLTDVGRDDGAHYFLRGTHRAEVVEQAHRERLPQPAPYAVDRLFQMTAFYDPDMALLFPDAVETLTGRAGEGMFEDTYGLHKGDIPKSRRLLAWVRYGLYRNSATYSDAQVGAAPGAAAAGRIPNTPRHRFVNRLLIEP